MKKFAVSLVVLALCASLVGVAQADNKCQMMGNQIHLVAIGSKPIGTGDHTKAMFIGEYLKTPKTGGEVYFVTTGVRQSLPGQCWVLPTVSFLGGWYPGEDALSLALTGGTNVGPVYLTLDFKRFSAPRGLRTKFWYHNLDYKFGPKIGKNPEWTVGVHLQKVDKSERWGMRLSNQLTPHVKLEGRYFRTLYGDQDKQIQFFRVQLLIS
jgi:hypothetical protein